MAVIYSYPVKSTPELTDKMLISDGTDNLTKQVTISGVKDTIDVVDSITATSPLVASASTGAITLSIPAATSGVDGYLTSTNWSTFNGKQPELQSGVNIKTINSNSILGSGDLVISGGAANPAGANTQVQFNSSGSFGASTNLTFSTSRLTVVNMIDIKGDGSSNAGKLKLYCQDNTTPHYVELIGPAHGGSPVSYSITLPNKIATQSAVSGGRVLEVDASGIGNWITTPTGGGSSYQAGNGIDINTGTTPDTINTGLLTNGGLVFDTAKMKVDLAATAMSGELRAVDGGTGQSVYGVGDLLYAETTTTLGALNISTNDKILGINNGATLPVWITNLVGQEVPTGAMLIGNGPNAMTQLNTTAKGTIAVGNGSTTTNLAAGTDTYVLTAKSAAATGLNWEAITYPTVNLASGVTGTLQVGNGGTGITTAVAGTITRGNGTNALVADTYLQYESTQKSLKIRGTGNTTPTMSAPLSINDVQGSSGIYEACIGLTPYKAAQGGKAISIGLDGYRDGIIVVRKNTNSGAAMIFQQVVSANAQVGSITMTNSATAYNTTSDYRSKENVVEMTGSVDRVKQLKPSRFNFISEPDTNIVDGFLAHEVSSIVPEAIHGEKDAVDSDNNPIYQGIDQSKLVPLLVGAIKELTARIEALEA
jgi:hypothetical protein